MRLHLPWQGRRLPLGTLSYLPFPWQVWLSDEEALTHLHVLGVTGSGKSRFLGRYFLTLLRAGLPATLIDPHGDLSELVLRHLHATGYFTKPGAFEQLLYLDLPGAERQGMFLPFNVLNQGYSPQTTARLVLEAMRRAWPSLDGGVAPTFENIVLAGVSVLIRHQLPLVMLHRLLVDRPWREMLLWGVEDQEIVAFFRDRFDRWGREQPLLIESSLRRVFLLSFSPVLRYSLGQQENALAYRAVFDQRQSVIVNLSLPDPDARRLFGSLLTVGAEQAALSLSERGTSDRPGSHHLLIDEFAEVSARDSQTFSRILALTRKFGLVLVLAHQMYSQASEQLRGALQNAGTEVLFRLGRSDAEAAAASVFQANPTAVKHEVGDRQMRRRTHPAFLSLAEQREAMVRELTELRVGQAILRRASGKIQRVTLAQFPGVVVDEEALAAVREAYLSHYFTPQQTIERQLAKYRAGPVPTVTKRREKLGRKP